MWIFFPVLHLVNAVQLLERIHSSFCGHPKLKFSGNNVSFEKNPRQIAMVKVKRVSAVLGMPERH